MLKVPPKHSISKIMGILKGKSAIRIFNMNKELKVKTYWGNHFWAKGYCVDTVGLNEEMIRRYVKFQEDKENREENK
jgi:putative transposase